jgi:hypothetical protein
VTFEEAAPGVIRREFALFRVGGNLVVDGKPFLCPSNEQILFYTLRLPTRGLPGIQFLARIKVASCCDEPPMDTSVCSPNSSQKFIICRGGGEARRARTAASTAPAQRGGVDRSIPEADQFVVQYGEGD